MKKIIKRTAGEEVSDTATFLGMDTIGTMYFLEEVKKEAKPPKDYPKNDPYLQPPF